MEYKNGLSKKQRLTILKSQLDTDYFSFESLYKELNDFLLPARGRFYSSDYNRGDRRNNKIFDNSGYLAARTLASGMMAGITSPARPWFKLTTPDPEMAEFGAVKEWLHVVGQRMQTRFARSNLYQTLPSLYGDLGVFGTSAMLMEEDLDEVSRFQSMVVGSYRIAKDPKGRVNVFARDLRMTVRQLVEAFGTIDKNGKADWSKFSLHVRNMWDKSQYETWIDVCHVVQPNQEYDPRKLDSKYKKFSSCYYEQGTDTGGGRGIDDGVFLREKGYDFFPVLAPRWQTTGADVYGTDCPGMVALGDVKQLQHGERRGLQGLDKIVNPPMTAPSSLKKTKASIISGDITYIDERDGAFRAAHEVRLSLAELEGKQAQVRQRIDRAFFVDLFLMLASSDRRDYTATEIVERKEEKLLAVGPVLEQLNQDVLDPLIDNQFNLMVQQGLIPPPPEELQGLNLKVEYISVMAQAQKLIGISGLERLANFGAGIIRVNPSSARKFDFDQMIDEYAEAMGTSPRVIRSDEEVAAMEAQDQAALAAQQQAQAMESMANTAKTLAGADMSGDNALNRLMAAAQAGNPLPNG